MKKLQAIIKYISLSAIIFLSVSCEEVIDVDLNSSDPVLVFDGQILLNQSAEITISYTTDYYELEDPEYVTDATVVLTTSEGESETLTHTEFGKYIGNTIVGNEGVEYTLSVTIDGETYTATSQILTPTQFVSVTPVESNRGMGSETYYELDMIFSNQVDEENYYLIKYFYTDDDGDQEETSTLSWEFFSNTETIEFSGFRIFEEGTDIALEIYSVDEGTYDYYASLSDINGDGGGGDATPYNPDSNFEGDVLGYFRAWSMDSHQITIPEEE